jgi:predicted transport protein
MYLYYIFSIAVAGIFIALDGHNIVKQQVVKKYNSWKRLNNMVSIKYKNRSMIIWISIKLLMESLYISLLQYLNKSLVQIDRNTYVLTYLINGNLYKHMLKIRRGPKPVLQIIDEKSYDVTEVIFPYLGPSYNWHGNELTPSTFGYKTLTFELSDGTEKVYNEKEPMLQFV